ncbi:MAG: NAD+ synthase [Gemmatimonadota bacterium]|nr:NAD+ synthase [Gemmatimonadota bacterium]MDH5760170.1 NAD+ synthase [Gemmatimonadota bacterium]
MNQGDAHAPLRVALVQFKPRKADLDANLEVIRTTLRDQAPHADLLMFPEASLSGYFLEGGVAEVALTAEALAGALGPSRPGDPDVCLGFYERWRRRLYNSVAYLEPEDGAWKIRHVHRKMFLPTYGVFDEARFVEPGTEVRAFGTRFGRMGMLICEDMWHSLPATVLALAGAELILVASASPARDFGPAGEGRPANLERWDRLAGSVAVEHGVFVAVAQLVGSEGGKLFPGGSVAIGPEGDILARGPLLDAGVTHALLDPKAIDRARDAAPLLSDLEQMLPHVRRALDDATLSSEPAGPDDPGAPVPATQRIPATLGGRGSRPVGDPAFHDPALLAMDMELVERSLVEFIREEVRRRRGFERVVLGVSGGVDSAVSLYLACKALGPENVLGLRLPYRTSSEESLEHARLVLDATGADSRTIDISAPIDAYVEAHEPDVSPLRKGNLMARLRAVILFDQSARVHALPLGTGNKSERLLGYFTWHADDSPPINPLGDLFKVQVWALARHLGVPDVIIDKPATADLVRGVSDEDELGFSYHQADPILHWLVRGYRVEELVEMGFDQPAVALVARRLQSTHWKRELPTVAILSSSAIGEFYLRPVDY